MTACLSALSSLVLANSGSILIEDSTMKIREVVVNSKQNHKTTPNQHLTSSQLEKISNNSIADALKFFSGIQIKDYGGVGGMKTVNIRSLGCQHLGISYDGILLGNAQNGQIDIGLFSLDNVEEDTGISNERVLELAEVVHSGTRVSVWWTMGVN